VADIGGDIDDMVAVFALERLGLLGCVVPDSEGSDETIQERIEWLQSEGIAISDEIPQNAGVIFVGGALTSVADFLRDGGHIDCLVANGGFAGDNVVAPDQRLRKFRGRDVARTYNFNLDVAATDFVLRSDRIGRTYLVGKNVCHSPENTTAGVWRESMGFLAQFSLRPGNRLHDLLATCEGLTLAGLSDSPLSCEYRNVYTFSTGLDGAMTEWGSSLEPTEYRKVTVAVGWASVSPRHDFVPRSALGMP
jgi:hypothetical protein